MDPIHPTPELLHFTERGSGPPLLLVHGLMVSGTMFDQVVDHFSAKHRVIVPDLRGHGSSRNMPPPYTVPQLAADLSRLLEHLSIRSADVLGYSQGGAVSQQLALDHPEQCGRLVLACTYAFNMATFRERMEGRLVPWLIRILGMHRFAKLVISQGLKQVGRERAAWVVGLIAGQDPALMVAAWRESMAFDSRSRLAEIRCPALIVAGDADEAVPLHHAAMLHQGIAGSSLAVLAGADHALIWARPQEFERMVDEFLDA